MNGANSRGVLSVDSCERSALVVLCMSWSPWEICWPLYRGEGLDVGMLVSEYVVVESCGAWRSCCEYLELGMVKTHRGHLQWNCCQNGLLTNDIVVCASKSEHKDFSGTSRTLDEEVKSDFAGSLLSGRLFIFWLGCGGTLDTRHVAIL
jgi:hypothetical protein